MKVVTTVMKNFMILNSKLMSIDSPCDPVTINTEHCITLEELHQLIDSDKSFDIEMIYVDMMATNLGIVELVDSDTIDVYTNTRSFLVNVDLLKKMRDEDHVSVMIQVKEE